MVTKKETELKIKKCIANKFFPEKFKPAYVALCNKKLAEAELARKN